MYTNHAPAPQAKKYLSKNTVEFAQQLGGGLVLGGWLGIFLLLFVAAGMYSYLPCASFAELGLFFFFFAALAANKWRWRRTGLDPLIGTLLAVQVLATVWAYLSGFGARSPYAPGADAGGVFGPLQILFDQLAALAAYYLAAWRIQEFRTEGKELGALGRDPLFFALFLSAGVVLLLCLLQWAMSFVHPSDDPRIQATFTNPNLLASYLLLIAPFAVGAGLAATPVHSIARAALRLLTAGLLFSLWLSQSRGAWIGIALAGGYLAAVLWTNRASGEIQRRERRGKAFFLLACGCLAALVFGALVAPRLEARWHGHSEEERAIIWSAAVSIIKAHPWLGIGADGFPAAMADLHLKQKNDFNSSGYPLVPSVHLHSHNLVLQAAVEKGIVGIAVCLWLVGAILTRCSRLFFFDPVSRSLLPVAAGAAGGWIALLTQCAADYTLWYAPVLILAWIALGVLFALSETGRLTDNRVLRQRKN